MTIFITLLKKAQLHSVNSYYQTISVLFNTVCCNHKFILYKKIEKKIREYREYIYVSHIFGKLEFWSISSKNVRLWWVPDSVLADTTRKRPAKWLHLNKLRLWINLANNFKKILRRTATRYALFLENNSFSSLCTAVPCTPTHVEPFYIQNYVKLNKMYISC